MKGNSPILIAGGIALSAIFGAIIGWGRFKPVVVPQESSWAHVASVCADPEADTKEFAQAMSMLIDHGLAVRLESGPCDQRSAIHVRVSPKDIDRLFQSEATYDAPEIRGAFERRVVSGVITDCTAYVEHGNDTEAIVHEIAHCLGMDHAKNAPAGHVMNREYSRIGLDDWRGM